MKCIDHGHLADEETVSGIIISRNATEITLRDATGADHRFPAAKIESLRPQKLSAMPEGLLSALTAQEIADILQAIIAEAAQ